METCFRADRSICRRRRLKLAVEVEWIWGLEDGLLFAFLGYVGQLGWGRNATYIYLEGFKDHLIQLQLTATGPMNRRDSPDSRQRPSAPRSAKKERKRKEGTTKKIRRNDGDAKQRRPVKKWRKMRTSHRGGRQRAAGDQRRAQINLSVSLPPFSLSGATVEAPFWSRVACPPAPRHGWLSFTLRAAGFTGRRIQCGPVRVHPARPGAIL